MSGTIDVVIECEIGTGMPFRQIYRFDPKPGAPDGFTLTAHVEYQYGDEAWETKFLFSTTYEATIWLQRRYLESLLLTGEGSSIIVDADQNCYIWFEGLGADNPMVYVCGACRDWGPGAPARDHVPPYFPTFEGNVFFGFQGMYMRREYIPTLIDQCERLIRETGANINYKGYGGFSGSRAHGPNTADE